MDPTLILFASIAAIIGGCLGLFTGLVPGIHVNTLASMMLVSLPAISGLLSGIVPEAYIPIVVCSIIMSASVVHSFVDFVPSVFIGAPDADTAVSVLPGHRLLLEGKGMVAVRSAAIGSLIGCSVAILIAIPMQYIMMGGISDTLNKLTKIVLLIVVGILLYNEYLKKNLFFGTLAFVLSGLLGYAVMTLPIPCTGILGEGTLLMPMLTGLFGLPIMLMSDEGHPFPKQNDNGLDPVGTVPGLKGVLMGCVAGWFPGITSTVGATVSATLMPEKSPERFISTVASIGTVTTILSLVTLSISGGGRSGTVIVIGQILGDRVSGFASPAFLMLLLSASIAAVMGYYLTIWSGKKMAGFVSKIEQKLLNKTVITFLIVLIFLTTGIWGMIILGISLLIGFIPVSCDSGKTVLCGCLILPVLLMRSYPFGFGFLKESRGVHDEPLMLA